MDSYGATSIRFAVSLNDLLRPLLLLIGIALRPSPTSTKRTTPPPQMATIHHSLIAFRPPEAPPPSHPASSLGGGPPTTSQTPLGGTSGMLLVGVGAGIVVVLLNVFVIGCCLHKRNEKRLKRGEGIHESVNPAVAAAAATQGEMSKNPYLSYILVKKGYSSQTSSIDIRAL